MDNTTDVGRCLLGGRAKVGMVEDEIVIKDDAIDASLIPYLFLQFIMVLVFLVFEVFCL